MLDAYKEIPGWFTEAQAARLEELIKEYDIRTVIEIGAFLGRSSAFFAARVDRVLSIDPFEMWEEGKSNGDAMAWTDGGKPFLLKFQEYTRRFDNIQLIQAKSAEAVEWPETYADLIYIDGAHDYESVARDIKLWLPHARVVICGDDMDENWPGVGEAVRELVPDYKQFDNCPLWYAKV